MLPVVIMAADLIKFRRWVGLEGFIRNWLVLKRHLGNAGMLKVRYVLRRNLQGIDIRKTT